MDTNKESNGQKALKAGLWYTISNVATKAIMVLTTPIFTRIMTKNDYGTTATFTSWYTLLITFCTLNLTYSIGRAKLDYPEQLDKYVGSMQVTSFIASMIFAIIGVIFVKPVSIMLELPIELVYLLAVYLIFAPSISLFQAKYKYQYKYKENIIITLYTTLTSVILSLIFVNITQNEKFYGRILGIVLPSVLLSIFFWIISFVKKNITFNMEYIKYGLNISLPLVINGISLNILAQSDRVVITKFNGTEMTAIYTIAYSLAILISLVLDSIGQAWLPWFHDAFAEKKYDTIKKNLIPLVIFGCYVGIGCIAVAPEAIWFLGGEGYLEGKWVVAPIALGLVCKFIYANYEHIELHLKKTKYIGGGTIIAAIMNVVLNLVFVPKFGFVAAGYTTFASYFVLMIIHYFITKYIMHVDVYNHKFLFAAIIIELIIAVGIISLYNFIVIRYLVIVVITLLLIYKYRNILFKLLKKK